MDTRDDKEAERKIRKQRTIFDQQLAQKQRDDENARLAKLLTEDQQAKLRNLEDTGRLLKHISELREVAAFMSVEAGEDERDVSELERAHHDAEAASDREFLNRLLA